MCNFNSISCILNENEMTALYKKLEKRSSEYKCEYTNYTKIYLQASYLQINLAFL